MKNLIFNKIFPYVIAIEKNGMKVGQFEIHNHKQVSDTYLYVSFALDSLEMLNEKH